MRSPAARAFAWEFGQQHRWGMLVIAGYVLFMVITGLLAIDWALTSDANVERFIGTIVLPLTAAVLYLLAVFSFGLSGDLAARQSMYPPRLFTLPVTTAALAGWPMLFGAAAMVVLAQAVRLASWPSEVEPPYWLLLYAPVLLAWTQVLTWAPYPIRGLRVVAAVALLISIDMIAIVGIELKPREWVMAAVLAPLLPLAWVAAYASVGRARRGDVPDWRGAFAPLSSLARVVPRREQFASPLSAQMWCEWRQHGWALPVLVAFVLPFALGLPFLDPESSSFVIISLVVVALTPPIMASFVASTARRASPRGDEYGLPPFLATRPLTSAALIAAKLRVCIVSTVITWVLVIAVVPLALSLSNTWPVVIERARDLRDLIGLPRAIAVTVLAVLALVATTWKRLVTSLYVGLSGRPWLVRTHIGVTLALLVAAIPLIQWIGSDTRSIVVRILDAVPVAAAILVALKISAAAWIVIRLDRSRLIEPRVLLATAAAWLAAVLALYAVFAWIAETPIIPRYALLLLAILAIPLTRLSAAPLALASNRHR
jgi:hypothetical protein